MCEVCNISKCYICSKGVNTLHLHDFVQCTVIHTNKDDLKFDVYIQLYLLLTQCMQDLAKQV